MLRRRPVAELEDDDVGEQTPEPSPIASAGAQVGSAWASRAVSALLLGCLVLAPVGAALGGVALYRAQAPAVPPAVVAAERGDDRAAAGELAQHLVVTWLGATAQDPDRLLAVMPGISLRALGQQGLVAENPSVAAITAAGPVWTVTVAVTLTDAAAGPQRRFFQVPVRVSGGGPNRTVRALMLPTPVAGPAIGAKARLDYRNQVDTNAAVSTTVAQFLSAYLAGQGDVTRYLSPGVEISAITPAPYAEVSLTQLSSSTEIDPRAVPIDGAVVRVMAQASAAVSSEQFVSVDYALTLTARAGRWEISALDDQPALRRAASSPGPTSSSSTPPSSAPASPATTP